MLDKGKNLLQNLPATSVLRKVEAHRALARPLCTRVKEGPACTKISTSTQRETQERVLQVPKLSSSNTEQGEGSEVTLEEKWLRLRGE